MGRLTEWLAEPAVFTNAHALFFWLTGSLGAAAFFTIVTRRKRKSDAIRALADANTQGGDNG